jgi:hypothetical protein
MSEAIIMHKYDNKLLKWSMSHTPMRKSLASLEKYRNMLLSGQSFSMGSPNVNIVCWIPVSPMS